MRRTRRNHAAGFKAKVSLAALQGDQTLVELAQAFDVHANQMVEWKQQMVECVFRRSRPPIPSECGHPSERSDARSPRLLSRGRLPVSSPAVSASILPSR